MARLREIVRDNPNITKGELVDAYGPTDNISSLRRQADLAIKEVAPQAKLEALEKRIAKLEDYKPNVKIRLYERREDRGSVVRFYVVAKIYVDGEEASKSEVYSRRIRR